MARKKYIVMWTRRPNGLASTKEGYKRIVLNPNWTVESVIVSRPGFPNVEAGNVLNTPYGAITFEGITDWFRMNHWEGRRVYLPFSVEYNPQNHTLTYTYLG